MNTPNLIGIAVFALLNFEQPEPAFRWDTGQDDHSTHAFVSYFGSSDPLHLVFSAGWSTTNNECPANFYVETIFAPRVTFTNGYYFIEFQE